MKANFVNYDHIASAGRILEILDSSDYGYEEKDSVPSRDTLTFTNGYYVNCSAMFVDMRGSKALPEKYKRSTLARIYRTFISELVALLNGNEAVSEVMIEGDCVWGIFDTRLKSNVDQLFSDSARVLSLVKIINWRLSQKTISPISVGVGLDYGRALMIKGGYRGSGINEVVWMGDVVSSAAHLCSHGSRSFNDCPIMLSDSFYGNLNDDNKRLCQWNSNRSCYHANIINLPMEKWLVEQK
jgi:class 3 adenylate cyclase